MLQLQRLAGNEAVAGLLQVSRDGPSSAASLATKTDNTQVALDAVDAFYDKAAKAKGTIEGEFYVFISIAYGHALMVAFGEMERAVGKRDVPALKAAIDQFRTIKGDQLIKELLAAPNGLETWKKVQADNAKDLDGQNGEQFVERVEAKLLPSYALAEAKKTGKPPKKLQQIADVQIRPIIIDDLNMMVEGATQAAAAWQGLPVPKKKGKSGTFEAGAAGTHFAMEMAEVIFEEGSLILELGIPELAILKFGLEIAGIWSAEAEQEEWEHKLQKEKEYESEAKNDLIEMYDKIRDHAHSQLDTLSLLCASRALQAHINPEGPEKLKLARFVREQIFGKDFPADLSGSFKRAKDKLAEIGRNYNAKLGGD